MTDKVESDDDDAIQRTPVMLRLPSPIAEKLVRASLERKLQKIKPWTQQDIAAEAISAWLQKERENTQ